MAESLPQGLKLDRFSFVTPNGLVNGLWACKRDFKKYPQPYPANFLKRVYALLNVSSTSKICHLFSGTIEAEYTVDLNPASPAKYKEDATHTHFPNAFFDVVLADPPYADAYAQRFGFEKTPKIKYIMREMRRLTKPNGYYGLLHFRVPIDWFRESGCHRCD